jgi:hypothetical protein
VNYFPKVVSKAQGILQLNLTLDKFVTLPEGSFSVVFQPSTKYDTRIEVSSISSQNILVNLNSFTDGGIFHFQLYYQNPNSFEFRSMFSISPQYNVSFTDFSSISLISETDMFYLNEMKNITVKINEIEKTHLTDDQASKIVCKLGNEILPTYPLSNNLFICTLSSPISKLVKLSMVYKNIDAFHGQTLISNNEIDIMFIGKLNSV